MTEIEALQDDFESAKFYRPTHGELISLIFNAYSCLSGVCNSLKAAYDCESEYNRTKLVLESAPNTPQSVTAPATKPKHNQKKK